MAGKGWRQLLQIYGLEDSDTVVRMALQGMGLGIGAGVLFVYFNDTTLYLARSIPFVPIQIWSLLSGFAGGLLALMSVCFLVTSANLWYCGSILRHHVIQRMLDMVDWSRVYHALDVGCGSGMLLNAVASQLKKDRSGGRVVGTDLWLDGGDSPYSMSGTLRNSAMEGVRDYVTCKSGDARSLPFEDDHFNLVVSALVLHKLGSEYGPRSSFAASERLKGLQEIVRVVRQSSGIWFMPQNMQ